MYRDLSSSCSPECRGMGDPRSGSRALCCTHNPRSQLEAHAHHHKSLLVQKNGKERFPAYKEPGNVQLGRGVKLKPGTQVMGSAAKEETIHRGGIAETHGFDPLNQHLFVKFTNSHEPGGTPFACVYLYICTHSTVQTISHPGLTLRQLPGCPSSATKISPQIWTCSLPLHIYTSQSASLEKRRAKQAGKRQMHF